MAEPIISFIPENDEAFRRGIERLAKTVSDFRKPFGLIANDWYKSNKIIFGLKSEGLYPPLGGFNPNAPANKKETRREKAERLKKAEVGFVYPLLKRNGDLEKSLTSKSATGSEYFLGRQTLVMGTSISYAKYHQSDRPRFKLPQRKVVFVSGGPAEQAKDSRIAGRLERWLNIINDYVTQVITGKV